MSEEEQRFAILFACGWKQSPKINLSAWRGGVWERRATGEKVMIPPDYLNDLNVMHEAEMTLSMARRGMMRAILYRTYPEGLAGEALHAGASKRAAAFLKAIGKWEDA